MGKSTSADIESKSEIQTSYINVYKPHDNYTFSHIYDSIKKADNAADKHSLRYKNKTRISRIKIIWKPGQCDNEDPSETYGSFFYLNINEFFGDYTNSIYPNWSRKEADNVKTKSSQRIACIRIPFTPGRYDP